MNTNPKHTKKRKKTLFSPFRKFIGDSRSVGITLVICTLISLVITNSPIGNTYLDFWQFQFHVPVEGIIIPHDLTAFINDVLMAVFFLLVGMEIKREMLLGELSGFKQSALPVFAALGGMIVPAAIYLFWNHDTIFSHGWGIPMATDIAFSLGILSLLGKRIPLSLKILLTALAIIDDLGAIIAIAVFYTAQIHWLYLILAVVCFIALVILNLLKIRKMYLYFLVGIGLWYCLFNSGVHATLAGVLLAFTIPVSRIPRLEHALQNFVNFIILPLFALANTAILFPEHIIGVLTNKTTYGIVVGLVLGKPIGILLLSFLVVKLKLARLPDGISWKHIWGMGMIAGIGFTMSIFIAMLAFTENEIKNMAKIAIIIASLVSGLAGYFYLKKLFRNNKAN